MLAALEAYAAAPLQTGDDYAADAVVCAVERLGDANRAIPQLRQLARRGVRQAPSPWATKAPTRPTSRSSAPLPAARPVC